MSRLYWIEYFMTVCCVWCCVCVCVCVCVCACVWCCVCMCVCGVVCVCLEHWIGSSLYINDIYRVFAKERNALKPL